MSNADSSQSRSADSADLARARALASPHAHIVFEDRQGTLRNIQVATLWKNDAALRATHKHCERGETMHWDDAVAVTNDMAIVDYLRATGDRNVPRLPAAGDRPWCYLDPCQVRAGIVNAGGPAPGLNVVNDSITKRHFQLRRDCQCANPASVVFGYRMGFQGLAVKSEAERTDKLVLIPAERLENWARGLGEGKPFVTDDHALDPVTFLHSSRFDLSSPENMLRVVEGIRRDRLDILYVVGGNGTQYGAQKLREALGASSRLVIVGGPKTMDQDLLVADTTFGFTTTVDHLVDAIHTFHSTVECTERIGMMQVFGAASGFVALYAAYCSGQVDYVILPEVVQKAGIWALLPGQSGEQCIEEARFAGLRSALQGRGVSLRDVCAAGILIIMHHAQNELRARYQDDEKRHALVVVAEGAKGIFGHSGFEVVMKFEEMVDRIGKATNVKTTPLEPQYLIRDNGPRSYDISLCKFIGKAMVDAALAGYTDCMVSRWCGQHVLVPLHLATCVVNSVDPRDYFYRTMAVRYKQELNSDYVARKWPEISSSAENGKWLKDKGITLP